MYRLKSNPLYDNWFSLVLLLIVVFWISGCATESHRMVASDKVESYGLVYNGPKTTMVVGNFQNRSGYMQGLFSSNTDRLGNQAKTILKTHLQQTNRFNIVDRQNLQQNEQEAKFLGAEQNIYGARYTVTGDVTEFGRKVSGDRQLFGILGSGKNQVAYAKVSLNIVDVLTSQIVYSTQGAGEYALSNREVIGFGGTASYDATLNGKVLNFAIKESVNNIVRDIQNGVWTIQQ
ncbi:curli production assembly protein CsgG [Desulfobacter hydrogenophilus]|uniref:Curli production assembly protein CsgG n=1 Tax=Desulfobacter hydrogenophilus TaxID=2291 RepID=A0A328FKY0_9BACT|nr:CsgG/HfaB family protein [Desulfobacter hydrogenophilus]NDY72281.1 curli production assembly protein CsgG [Desulfobacter hydrogenophilus]QBH12908.1 curli production assembly protein CsgG [Desulfobacter hydrogenophilus]RAM03893.1 curli production assembly protein CsgG [Desulfobacter hydrogenophilus]